MKRREPITLGSLAPAKLYDPPLAPGLLKADRATLNDIRAGLPSKKVEWLHQQNFGDGFWLSQVTDIEHFVLSRTGPEHEFLDQELERLRCALWESVRNFAGLVATYTFSSGRRSERDNWMSIPKQYDEHWNHTSRRFFQTAEELNAAAEDVWNGYKALIKRARLVLAFGELSGGEE